jgi:transposase
MDPQTGPQVCSCRSIMEPGHGFFVDFSRLVTFQTADRFAGVAGLAPAPRDSGRITGNHHRPRRYDRRLLRVFYLSGLSALKSCPVSRTYYDRKRAEGKTHIQAMLSLARRRLNVLWAMLRDGTTFIRVTAGTPSMAA